MHKVSFIHTVQLCNLRVQHVQTKYVHISRAKIHQNTKFIMSKQLSRSNKLTNKKFLFHLIVPEKVFNLQDPVKVNPNVVDLNNTPNEDDLWWNQRHITHLDCSSNVLTEINPDIGNLLDLTVLNVS